MIKIINGHVEFNGKRMPLISGEFHYWRNNRNNWKSILASIKGLGLNIVSTYVPWNYHEVEGNKYDFTGVTDQQRDLIGFIKETISANLYVILRPGPYIYAEWSYGGPPERAVKYHRLDPRFLAMAKVYIKEVANAIKPYLATNGGNIIMLQADNEPYPYPFLEDNSASIGCFGGGGIFAEFLKEKYNYNTIEELNSAWHSQYASFNDVCLHYHEPTVDEDRYLTARLLSNYYKRRFIDSQEFIGWYTAEIVRITSEWFKEYKIDVPVYVNGWSPYAQDFDRIRKYVDLVGYDSYVSKFFLGKDILYNEFRDRILEIKVIKSKCGFCYCAELGTGNIAGEHALLTGILPPQHYIFNILSYISHGMCGWNYYMLVDRDNWFSAPINERGLPTMYYPAFKEISKIVSYIDLADLKNFTDISLMADKHHRFADRGNQDRVLDAVFASDLDFEIFDSETDDKPRTSFLFYTGSDWLSRCSQEKLKEYVLEGGTIIFFNAYPAFDENGNEYNGLDIQSPSGIRPVNLPVVISIENVIQKLTKGGHLEHKVNFFFYSQVDGNPIKINAVGTNNIKITEKKSSKNNNDEFICGYVKEVGKGKIAILGGHPCPELISLIMEFLNIPYYCKSNLPHILTTVHKHKDALVFFAINRSNIPTWLKIDLQADKLSLNPKKSYEIRNIRTGKMKNIEGEQIENESFYINPFDVTIVQIKRA